MDASSLVKRWDLFLAGCQCVFVESWGGSSSWAQPRGVCGMGWDGMGASDAELSSRSSSKIPVVMADSGCWAGWRAGKESLELVPRPLLLPVCVFSTDFILGL